MPIPKLTKAGLLPQGEYLCTLEEIFDYFGQMPDKEWRQMRCQELKGFVEEVKKMKLAQWLVVDGSFVTNKEKPSDIDVFLVIRNGIPLATANFEIPIGQDLNKPNRLFWRGYPKVHLFFDHEGTLQYQNIVNYWQMIREDENVRKGYLKVKL